MLIFVMMCNSFLKGNIFDLVTKHDKCNVEQRKALKSDAFTIYMHGSDSEHELRTQNIHSELSVSGLPTTGRLPVGNSCYHHIMV